MTHPVFALIPFDLQGALLANAASQIGDPVPLLKIFNPVGPGRWLVTELMPDEETMHGLCDLGDGAPELGFVNLYDLLEMRLPFGARVVRDPKFSTSLPVSVWRSAARRTGSICAAEALLRVIARREGGVA